MKMNTEPVTEKLFKEASKYLLSLGHNIFELKPKLDPFSPRFKCTKCGSIFRLYSNNDLMYFKLYKDWTLYKDSSKDYYQNPENCNELIIKDIIT